MENEKPHFTSGVTERDLYGERQAQGLANDLSMGGPRGGGGFPWFRGSSPTFPTGPVAPTTNPNPVRPYQPSDWQGPTQPGGGNGLSGLFAGMSARDVLALITGLTSVVGGAMTNRPNTDPSSATNDPQMKELTELMMGRMRKSEPMFDSVQAMANGLLPTQYQKGGGGMP